MVIVVVLPGRAQGQLLVRGKSADALPDGFPVVRRTGSYLLDPFHPNTDLDTCSLRSTGRVSGGHQPPRGR